MDGFFRSDRRSGNVKTAHAVAAMIQRRVVSADIRFDVVNGAECVVGIESLKEGTGIAAGTPFRLNPDPAGGVYQGQQIFSAELLPALDVTTRGMQVTAEEFTAMATGAAAASTHLLVGLDFLPKPTNGIDHHGPSPFAPV